MSEGLIIDIDQFKRMPTKQQLTCLYSNQVELINLVRGYKVYYKITSVVGSVLLAGVGILFKMHLGGH